MQRLAPVSFFLIVLLLAVFSAKFSTGIPGSGPGAVQSSIAIGSVHPLSGYDAAGIADGKKLSGQSGKPENIRH
ncbi:hypothetical protein ACX0G9_14560 [Flavitalea flava]